MTSDSMRTTDPATEITGTLTQFMNRTLKHNANSVIIADFRAFFFKKNEILLIDINVPQLESGLAELISNFIEKSPLEYHTRLT